MTNLTDITIILDRSGSMESIKEATITAFNLFVKQQKEDGLPTNLSFIQFDDQYEQNFVEKNIHLVKELNVQTFQPRGMTALLDAIGSTIKAAKKRIKKSEIKPDKVILTIITDGYENASTKYTREKIFKMIRKREEKDNWKFLFLAANQDAIYEGSKFGIHEDRAMTYRQDYMGTRDAFNSISQKVSSFKSGFNDNLFFDDEDRRKQQKTSSKDRFDDVNMN